MSKHTPGPWTRAYRETAPLNTLGELEGQIVLLDKLVQDCDPNPLDGFPADRADILGVFEEVNAVFVSAALTMLAGLEAAIARIELVNQMGDPKLSGWLENACPVIARAAIALATGEEGNHE